MRRLLLLVLLLGGVMGAGAGRVHAQYGKVTGRVTDAASGVTLPGVNVRIEGLTLGASTDIDGAYTIIGVRPGTYTVIASFIGFETVRVENVRVQIDLTTEVDITMGEQVIEGQEVVVTATRPLIQKDLTATTSIVSGEEIRSLPLENFQDVVNLQAGVVNGHFRGGRLGEVAYLVDGLPVTDVFDGNLALSIENNMVEELQVVTGAFNAEYGQALSGVVNVVTREGGNAFSGRFSTFLGDYATRDTDLYAHLDAVDPTAVRNAEASLDGPILKDRLFFSVNGRYFENKGWVYGRDVFGFEDVGVDNSGRLSLLHPSGSGDSSFVSLNPYEKTSGQAKLTWRVGRGIRIAGNVLASREQYRSYGGEGDHRLYYFPDGQLHRKQWARNVYLKWTHTLSNRTFYEAGITNSYNTYRQYLFEDPLDERYRDRQIFNDFTDPLLTSNFKVGGTDNSRFHRSSNTYLFKADLTSQFNDVNLVKVGLEVRRHDLSYNDDFVVVNEDTGDQFVSSNGRYDYQPYEASAYVQDKVELGSLILNLGLRFDYFNPNAPVLRDPRDPAALFLENRLQDATVGPDGLPDFTPAAFFTDAEAKWQVSPRVGVAFPISEGGVIHFSYGHFFQVPNFSLLYQNPFFLLGSGGSGLIGLVGNANLDPEQTINGEIGLKQEITATTAVELTAYYRDIRNLAGTATDPIIIEGTSARYGMLVNSDFGFVRGIVFRLDQRVGGNVFASADYTYQVAKSNASDPSQVYNAAAARQQLEQQIVATNWDQRHTANVSFSYRQGTSWGFGLIASMGSGEPYTPAQTTKQTGVILPTTIPLNSERKPFFVNVDLDFHKNFAFVRGTTIRLFGKIDNLLDRRNEVSVFGDTGRATYSLQQNVDDATFRGDESVLERWYERPYFFTEPRRVTLGVSYSF